MKSSSTLEVAEAIERIGKPVAERIDALLSAEIDRWSQLDPSISDPLATLRRLIAGGGKRLRPAFCYWAFAGAGGDTAEPEIVDAAAALELLHAFALVHDDVMDDSPSRRGADAAHVEYKKMHQAKQWRGESRRFGEGVAILIGDMSFVYADLLMANASRSTMAIFNEMRVELNVGQFLDIQTTVSGDVSLPKASKIASYKSGKYTVERPMHLGAAMAGRFDELKSAFTGYGVPVGEAFQLRDDLLGAFGDEAKTGKPVGGDLREGKPTMLYALALQRANDSDRKVLQDRYGAPDLTDNEVADLQQILQSTGASRDLDDRIDQLVNDGLGALENCDLEPDAKQKLVGLAYFVAGRQY